MKFGTSITLLLLQLDSTRSAPSALKASSMTVSSNGAVSSGENTAHMFIPAMKSFFAVQIPANLHNKHGESHRLAHFGLTSARGSMSRFTYFTEGSLCEPMALNANNTYPKRDEEDHEKMTHPFFILAQEKEGCTAVRMARNAQEFGASALILGERWCRCEDKACTDSFPGDSHCLEEDPPLTDDGSAKDVSIPTVLLHKKMAQKLYQEMSNQNQPVMLELTWGLPLSELDVPEGENVLTVFEPHYHLWTTAADPLFDAISYKHMRALSRAFGHSAHFSPRFYIQDGKHFNCPKSVEQPMDGNACNHLCTNHGRYCAANAMDDISGHDVVKETLRRLCIHQHYPAFPGDNDENHKTWHQQANTAYFDYVIYHLEHCSSSSKYTDDDCIDAAYKAAKIDKKDVEMCMKDTGSVESDAPNSLLDEMIEKRELAGIVEVPAISINNRHNVQKPSARTLFDEICTHFWDTTLHRPLHKDSRLHIKIPPICEKCGSCPNVMGCLDHGGKCVPWKPGREIDHTGSFVRKGHFWTIVFLLLGTMVAAVAWVHYKKRESYGAPMPGDPTANLMSGYAPLEPALNEST